jgi:hypothetical protein
VSDARAAEPCPLENAMDERKQAPEIQAYPIIVVKLTP